MDLRLLPPFPLLLLLAVAACGGGEGEVERPATPAGPRNVLLISLDSARRDLVGVYGGGSSRAPGVAVSPRLDALAREGVLLEDAYATTSWTLPSHVTMLSGVPEVVHGVDGDGQRPRADLPWLPALLRARGYRTAGFYSGPYLAPRFGFARGFDRYEACYGEELAAAAARAAAVRAELEEARAAADPAAIRVLESALGAAERRLETASHRDVSGARVTDAALAELDAAAAGDAPFFLFAHYFDPHYDYAPPAPWDRAFDPRWEGEETWDDFIRNPRVSVEDPTAPSGRRRVLSARALENVRARYSGEMRWIDGELGRLLDRLDALGLAERTLVVVTADHGDEFFEHGGIGHRHTLFEEVVRVPLVLRLPGVLPAGARVGGLVSLADLAPTILELSGVAASAPPFSASFLPLLRGEDDGAARDVVGRLVTTAALRIHLPRPGGERVTVGGRLVRVVETYRRGALKLTRERTWARANDGVAPVLAREVAERHGRATSADELSWIDVEAFPGEEAEHRSSDFSAPGVRAALRAFHDRYVALLAARGRVARVEGDEDLTSLLRGLGYGDGGEASPGLDDAALLLPPPGPGR